MRIAIVSAFYRPNWGYQENLWVQQLVHDGHEVRVITPGRSSGPIAQMPVLAGHYEEQRIKALGFLRSIFLGDISQALLEYQPDAVMWVGPGMFFGRQLAYNKRLASIPVATFWSENLGMHEFDWRKKGLTMRQRLHALAWRVLRCREMRRALRRSQVIVGNTLQTLDVLKIAFGDGPEWPQIERKHVHFPLGYSPLEYAWDPSLREATRRRLGLGAEDVVVCFSSRFDPGAKARDIATAIGGIRDALTRRADLKALVVGFADNATSADFRRLIADSPTGARIQCHPFANRRELNEYYNASDMAIFTNASISAQAALGTGLYTCLADNGSMEDLITIPEQGVFFEYGNSRSLADRLVRAAEEAHLWTPDERQQVRQRRVEASRWLGYDRILSDLFARLDGSAASGAAT